MIAFIAFFCAIGGYLLGTANERPSDDFDRTCLRVLSPIAFLIAIIVHETCL